MATHGPTIPTAIMITAQGRVEVHPAAEDWYQKVVLLRYASQSRQLFCPDCGERLKYYSEVRTPHFQHLKDTQGCTNEERYPDRANRRREKWFRNSLIASFRQAFPPGTRFLADDYLGNHAPYLEVRLPSTGALILHSVTEKPDMQVWERRSMEFEATGLPVLHVFGRGRVKGAIRNAEIGRSRIVIDDGLNADHQDASRPLLVDIAHVAKENFFGMPLLKKDPATLYFFEASESPNAPGVLTILRGLMPSPTDTVYHGVALKVETTGQGTGRLRFSLAHGFYTTDDLEVLVWLRNGWRRRRKKRPTNLPSAAATWKHPLRLRWEQKQEDLVAEQERLQAEQERIRDEAKVLKAQQEQRRAEHLDALGATNERSAELDSQSKEVFRNLLRILLLEGTAVLGGRTFAVPHPEVFSVPPTEWQSAILGFACRAGVPFNDDEAARWLMCRGYAERRDDETVQANMRAFWEGAEAARLVTTIADRWGNLTITPAKVEGSFQWPIKDRAQAKKNPALCIVCAVGEEKPCYRMTDKWRYHDPANRLCLCVNHAGR
jgi:hypothetical protein